ncbi:putative PB1 domain-containing protein [Helianthus annuus]|nr:putative PB1 domain-containing protein [Helianthus annuus]KAJ0634951.1 putative PB1 domain-containing protein [Helianthus annuus]
MSSGFELGDKSCTVLSVNMEPDVIQTSSDSVADNFMSSDSELSMANPTNLSIEITSKKRKIESLTEMVTAEISHNSNKKKIQFSVSMGLAYLEHEVLRSLELKGKKLRLKYMDEDDDLILIASDEDLMYAVATTGTNNNINLTCLSD